MENSMENMHTDVRVYGLNFEVKWSLSPMQEYIWKADQIINLDNILTKLHWRLLTRFRIELSESANDNQKPKIGKNSQKQVVSF